MVKKVLDIIPPKKQEVSEEAVSEVVEEKIEAKPQPKPKITYIPKRMPAPVLNNGGMKLPSGTLLVSKIALVLIVVLGVFIFLDNKLAKATITILPETEDLKSEVLLTVDSSLKESVLADKAIPGTIITAEKTYSEDFAATGLKNSQNTAQGTVKIYNNFSIAQRLIKGTRLQAPLEKFQPALSKDETPWFRTAADVTVGAKASADVLVVADGTGEKYNIEPSIFSIPGLVGTPQYTFIYGQSFEKFRGGEKGVLPEVKQEDLDGAKDALTKKAEAEIKKDMEIMVPENHVLIAETVKIEFLDAVAAAVAGANVEKFTYQVKVRATGMIFDKNELDTMAKAHLLSQVEAGLGVYEKSFSADYVYLPAAATAASAAGDLSVADMKVEAKARVYQPLDEVFVKKGLAEKKVEVAKFFLMNQPKIKNVQIDVSPFWRTSIPKDLEKIQVNLNLE
jgi:hypothetical protein